MDKKLSRRGFLKAGAVALGTFAVCHIKGIGSVFATSQNTSQVFFTPDISINGLVEIYSKINKKSPAKSPSSCTPASRTAPIFCRGKW